MYLYKYFCISMKKTIHTYTIPNNYSNELNKLKKNLFLSNIQYIIR